MGDASPARPASYRRENRIRRSGHARRPLIFSSTTEYGIRGLSELAARGAGRRVLLDELVAGTDLPRDFLAKIFQRLTGAGILASAKGRGGGFMLARAAHAVTLMQVVEVLEGSQSPDRCAVGLDTCDDAMACALHDLHKPIRQRLKDYLNTTTLADLASSLRSKPSWQARRAAQLLPPAGAGAGAPVAPPANANDDGA